MQLLKSSNEKMKKNLMGGGVGGGGVWMCQNQPTPDLPPY